MKGRCVTIALPYLPPLDWPFLLGYLRTRATAGVETVAPDRYTRTIELGGYTGTISVSSHPENAELILTIRGAIVRHAEAISGRVRALFDLDVDLASVHSILTPDPWLGPLVLARPGIRIPGAWSAFELIVRAIVGQQVTVKAGTTIMGRIASRLGKPVDGIDGSEPALLFPSPRTLAEADLTAIGMPSKRVAALQSVSRAIADETIPFSDAGACPDGVKQALLGLPGIGPWTVEYFALRALRDADAWPGTDLVLRQSLRKYAPSMSASAALARTDRWRPWRAYAAMHLWNEASQSKSAK
jgi:DNA-3-methyladenine glycosylase II